jgi:DNA-binding NarL/FixJ family response regulator
MKILIAEDHSMVREGLKNLLLSSGLAKQVEEAKNGLEASIKAREFHPDIVILDYEMPDYNGIYAAQQITNDLQGTPVLMVSMFHTKEHVLDALRAGVKGFLPKEAKSEELIAALRALADGQTWFKGMVAEFIAEAAYGKQSGIRKKEKNLITRREMEVLKLYAEGKQSNEIADILNISRRTAEVHKANIFKKLHLRNNTELMRYAIRNNLVKI